MFTSILNWFRNHPVPAFFLLTFGIAWALWLPLGLFAPEHYLWSLPLFWSDC